MKTVMLTLLLFSTSAFSAPKKFPLPVADMVDQLYDMDFLVKQKYIGKNILQVTAISTSYGQPRTLPYGQKYRTVSLMQIDMNGEFLLEGKYFVEKEVNGVWELDPTMIPHMATLEFSVSDK